MTKVGVIGLGMMGLTHLDVYRQRADVELLAICDRDPDRLSGKVQAVGNFEGQAQGGVADLQVERHDDIDRVIQHPEIDLIDLCLPTDMHVRFGTQVLEAGKHLIVEKPLARTAAEAQPLLAAQATARGTAFVGHCMRFWPGWTWLKEAIDERRFGPVRAATFRRVCSHPPGAFYADGDRCGGGVLDLHIHDADFVHFCFGMPRAVSTHGYAQVTNRPDHVLTWYHYDDVPLVTAEGSWCMADGFSFSMCFTVNFADATAVYDSSASEPLVLYQQGRRQVVEIDPRMGYDLEIGYFLDCLAQGREPRTVTLQDAANSLRIIDAEVESLRSGQTVPL